MISLQRISHLMDKYDLSLHDLLSLIEHACIDDFAFTQSEIDFIKTIHTNDTAIEYLKSHADELQDSKDRKDKGQFFTENELSNEVHDIITQFIHPSFIIEPFIGGGSLIKPFIKTASGIGFDIDEKMITMLNNLNILKWKFFHMNFVNVPIEELMKRIPETATLMFYTNPPFGSVSTNAITSREMDEGSHTIDILYENAHKKNKYGTSDLIIPAIGKMIDCIKYRENGYLGFFSQFGLFCGKSRYQKLINVLLHTFEFVYGQIYSGERFNGVSKKKPISFTLWKYKPNAKTSLYDLTFVWNDKKIGFKESKLLKEYWNYDSRKRLTKKGIIVQHNESFNASPPKILHNIPEKGGSEIHKKNVKKPLHIPYMSDELFLSLWSTVVGHRAIVQHPLYIDNAYTHLPNYKSKYIRAILGYTLVYHILMDMKGKYTDGLIHAKNGKIVFGSQKLTNEVHTFLSACGALTIGKNTDIATIIHNIQTNTPFNVDKTISRLKTRIHTLLYTKTSYFENIPIQKRKKGLF